MLLPRALLEQAPWRLLLDAEPHRPGEDELAGTLRWLQGVWGLYLRAFDLLLADAFYAQAPFFNFLLAHGKHALVVLKDERRKVYHDVQGVFPLVPPQQGRYQGRQCRWWDLPGPVSWPQTRAPLRVIRSLETYWVRSQRTCT